MGGVMSELQNCWEVSNCERWVGGTKAEEFGICPVFKDESANGINQGKNGGRICWAISGTFCGGEVQGSFANKRTTCMSCDFFKKVREEEPNKSFQIIKYKPFELDENRVDTIEAKEEEMLGDRLLVEYIQQLANHNFSNLLQFSSKTSTPELSEALTPLAGSLSQHFGSLEKSILDATDELEGALVDLSSTNDVLETSKQNLEVRNKFIRDVFGRYMSNDVVDLILDTPKGLNLGGENVNVSILMSDLRGFSVIAENQPPEDVVEMLNIYLDEMVEIILAYGGTIDSFIGDAILVIFGAPLTMEEHAIRAVACATAMQNAMENVNKKNIELGHSKLSMGIGINSGDVVVGNIGSKKQVKFSVIGQVVNMASRVESYTTGSQILVSEETQKLCGDSLEISSHMEVHPKGSSMPIKIFDVSGINEGNFKINLLETKNIKIKQLQKPLSVSLQLFTKKHLQKKVYSGVIKGLNKNSFEIVSTIPVKVTDDLKIVFSLGSKRSKYDIHAKVTSLSSSLKNHFIAGFSVVPHGLAPVIDGLLAEEISESLASNKIANDEDYFCLDRGSITMLDDMASEMNLSRSDAIRQLIGSFRTIDWM
jgi:class 3 adenylate cyclase